MTRTPSHTLFLGRAAGEHLRLEVLGRAFPGATDLWDGNQLAAQAEVRLGGLGGRVEGDLWLQHLERFHEQLERLHATLTGEAVLATMDRWLSVSLHGDGRGHVDVRLALRDHTETPNELQGGLALDQTELPALLGAVAEVLTSFPAVGTP